MKTCFLTTILLAFCCLVGVAQTAKRKAQRPLKPVTPTCVSRVPTYDEFLNEIKQEWRVAATSQEEVYFYNTRKMQCENGILKIWIKIEMSAEDFKYASELKYTMIRYEVNCRKEQMRMFSKTGYNKSGNVIIAKSFDSPKWEDVVPDSVGERILETVCYKTR